MNINEIKNAINETLADPKTKSILKEEIDKLADEKAQMLLDKHKEEIIEKYLDREVRKIKKTLSKYVNETVKEFLSEHKNDFKRSVNNAKVNYVLESLSSVLLETGVKTEEIISGVNNSKAEISMLKKRVNVLKENLQEEQERIKNLQNESKEILENNNEQSLQEQKNLNSKIKDLKNALLEENAKNKSLENEKNSLLNENKKLNKENISYIQKGIINDMKKELTLTESKKFEDSALKVPFTKNKEYVLNLKKIRKNIINERLEDSEETGELRETYTNDLNAIPDSLKRFI